MPNITVVVETITPMFLAGAEPGGKPDLRVPSIRGALRYWSRALLGGFSEFQDFEKLRLEESKIFGSTESKLGGASSVVIKAQFIGSPPNDQPFKKQDTVWINGRRKPTGRDYLWWAMDKSGSPERGNFLPPKRYMPSGTEFKLSLQARVANRDFSQELHKAGAALWCFVQLGALGARSRRTAGCFSVKQTYGTDALPSFETPDAPEKLAVHLQNGLETIRKGLNYTPAIMVNNNYDILHPDTCKIWVLTGNTPWASADAAVEEIGAKFRDFRGFLHYEPDHKDVHAWIQKGDMPSEKTVQRSVFGLPIQFRYSSERSRGDTLEGSLHERRASPLHLHILRLADNKFVGLAVLFKSSFLEKNEKLTLKYQKHKALSTPPNFDLIEDFVRQFSTLIPVKI